MDKQNWYFRQRVTEQEIREFQTYVEEADQNIVKEVLGNGILGGGFVTATVPPSADKVNVSVTIARSLNAKRLVVQDKIGDTVSAIVRGLTLQLDGISVPNTVGTYILFKGALPAEPFDLVGQTLKLARSEFPGNNGEYEILQVVTTDWGGLIPAQIMVRVGDELDEQGYTSGLAPRGTIVLAKVDSPYDIEAQAVYDELLQDIRPINTGNERWVSLYARFSRLEFDQRKDGNGLNVNFESLEYYKLFVDASKPEALAGTALKPDLRTNDDVLLVDILLKQGEVITDDDISYLRQKRALTLEQVSQKAFEYANIKLFGATISWDGSTLSTASAIQASFPNNPNLITIPAFSFVLADGDVVYLPLPRNVSAPVSASAIKTTRGNVGEGDANFLTIELAGRVGSKIGGLFVGELEAGEERTIGDNSSADTLTYIGAPGETANAPDYAFEVAGALESQENYGGAAGDSLTKRVSILSSAVADKAQDKLAGFLSDFDTVVNTTSALKQVITFTGNRTLNLVLPGSAANLAMTLTGALELEAGQAAYATIDRNTSSSLAMIALTVGPIIDVPVDENTFIFAFRLTGTSVYLWDRTQVPVGTLLNPTLVSRKARQDANAMLIRGGQWSWDLANNALTFTADAFVSVAGLTEARNRIPLSAAPIILPNDGDVAYVLINRVDGAATDLSIGVCAVTAVPVSDDVILIARRVGNAALVGRNALRLNHGERGALDFDRGLVRVRVVSFDATTLPTSINPVIDGETLVDGDAVLFANSAINKVYVLDNASTSSTWFPLEVFEGDSIPLEGSDVWVDEGTGTLAKRYIYDGMGWLAQDHSDVTLEPTGFPNRIDSTIAFVEGTRTFTIAPTSSLFDYYVKGVRKQRTTSESIVIPDIEGLHYVYYEGNTLTVSQAFNDFIYKSFCWIATIYWDATNKKAVVFGDERHGVAMDNATHQYLHDRFGFGWKQGLSLANYNDAGDGSSLTHVQVDIDNGILVNEDIYFTVTDAAVPSLPFQQDLSPAALPILYLDGTSANFRRNNASNILVKPGTSRIQYNKLTGSSWGLADASANGNFVAMWAFGTNDPRNPIVLLMGQREDTSLNDALANNSFDNLTFSNFPSKELKLLYRFIFQTSSAFANTAKAALKSVTDFRKAAEQTGATSVMTSHQQTTGRDQPDSHPATAVSVNTTSFLRVLTATEINAQLALDKLDLNVATKLAVFQDRSLKLFQGGTWTWNGTALSWSEDAYIDLPGIDHVRNRLDAATLVIPSGSIVYVVLNRTPGGITPVIPQVVSGMENVPFGENVFVIMRRWAGDLTVGHTKFQTGESKVLDSWMSDQFKTFMGPNFAEVTTSPGWAVRGAALRTIAAATTPVLSAIASMDAQIDKFFGQLRLVAHATDTSRIKLTGAEVTMLDGSVRVQTLNNLILSFDGAEIDFFGTGAGNIYAADGTTLLGTFTLTVPASGQYRWYAVSLSLNGQDSASNRSLATVKCDAATADGASAAAAPRARFTGSKAVAQFCLLNSAGTTVLTNIIQLGSGSGDGGGSGGGAGEINYISSDLYDYESGSITGIAVYNDGAVAAPLDATGGTPSGRLTVAATQTNPLYNTYSILISKSAAGSAQGEGVSIPATVPLGFQLANLSKISYLFETTGLAASEVQMFVIDVTNSKVIIPRIMQNLSLGKNKFLATWEQTTGADFRLAFHVKGTSALAWTLKADLVLLGPGTTGTGYVDQSPQLAGSTQEYSGSVAAWATVDGMIQKNGWAYADGSTFDILKYPDLYSEIGTTWNTCAKQDGTGGNYTAPAAGLARLPDLRGVFMRGTGTSSRADGTGDVVVSLGQFSNDTTSKNGLSNAASTVTGTIGSTDLSHTHGPGNFAAGLSLSGSAPSLTGTTSFAATGHQHLTIHGQSGTTQYNYVNSGGDPAFGSTVINGPTVVGTFGTFTSGNQRLAYTDGPTSNASVGITGGSYSLGGTNAISGVSAGASIGAAMNHTHSFSSGSAAAQVITGDLETAPRWIGANRIIKLWNPSSVNVASERKRSPLGAGFVVANASPNAQAGWLLCDGAVYAKSDYSDLYLEIGDMYALAVDTSTGAARTAPAAGFFRVPDYRGLFIRSVGTNNLGTTTTLGGWQDDRTAVNGLSNASSAVTGTTNIGHTHGSSALTASTPLTNTGTISADHSHTFSGSTDSRLGEFVGATNATVGQSGTGAGAVFAFTGGTGSLGHAHNYSGTTSGVSSNHTHQVPAMTVTGTAAGQTLATTNIALASGSAASQVITGDAETRPQNVGAYFYIKAWDDTIDLFGFGFADETKSGLVSASAQKFAGVKDYVDGLKAKALSYNAATVLTAAQTIPSAGFYPINSATGLTFPLVSAVGLDGQIIEILNMGAGFVVLDPNGTETISGDLTLTLNQYENLRMIAVAGNWFVI